MERKIAKKLMAMVFVAMLVTLVSSGTVNATITVEKLTQLTTDRARDCAPVWSPTGHEILFDRNLDIYKVSSDGSYETQLTSNPNVEQRYKWSPDGTKIIYDKDNTNGWNDVWIMNADGSSQIDLTNNPQSTYGVWSPDGTKIAYVHGSDFNRPLDLIIMNPDGSNKQIIATGQPSYGTRIAWSPDASKIAFSSGATGSRGIRIINADGTSLTPIASGDIMTQTQSWQTQVWSADGSKIVYHSDENGNWDIYTINAGGTGKTQLTTDTSDDRYAYFSPDGNKIIFVSDITGNNDIWVMDEDGGNKVQLTTSTSDDIQPVWSPDGSKIVFMSDRSGNYDIWVMEPKPCGDEGKPDLIITDIWWDKEDPKIGDEVFFSCIEKNQGTAETPSDFGSKLFIDDEGWDLSVRTSLGAGESRDKNFTHVWLATAGTHTIKVSADWEKCIDESDETNNALTKSLEIVNLEGWVLSADGNGIADVTISLSQGGVSTTTSPNGYYSFKILPEGHYTISASKTGYNFNQVTCYTSNDATTTAPTITGNLDPTKVNAMISDPQYPSGSFVVGGRVPVNYTIQNTGSLEYTFYAGYSVITPGGKYWDAPCKAVTLGPGESAEVQLHWTVQDDAPLTYYDVVIAVWANQQLTYLYDKMDSRTAEDSFNIIEGEESIPGWFLYEDEQRIVKVDGKKYTATKAFSNEVGPSWLIRNEEYEVEPDLVIYKKTAETASISSWMTPDGANDLREMQDKIESFTELSVLAKCVLWIRDTGSNLLGKYAVIAATGGGSLTTQMPAKEAVKEAAKEIAKDYTIELKSIFEEKPYSYLTETKIKEILWDTALIKLKSAAWKMDTAAKIIETHDEDLPWSYTEAHTYYMNYKESVINASGNMHLILELQPGADLKSQVKDVTKNAIEGATSGVIDFNELLTDISELEAVESAGVVMTKYEELFNDTEKEFNENAELLQKAASRTPSASTQASLLTFEELITAQEERPDTPSDKHVIMPNIKVLQTSSQSGKILFLRDLNTDWDHYADLAGMLEEKGFTIVEQNINPITLDFLTCYDGVVFSPLWTSREIDSLEAEALADFVRNGGRLLLIGEHGGTSYIFSDEWDNSVNKVGGYFGITFAFARVCDPTDHYLESEDLDKGVDLPFITDISQHEVTEGISKFVLVGGTALQISAPAIAVAYSDSDAWLDTNYLVKSGHWVCIPDDFAVGRFPVLAVSRYGSGKVVAIGDSSIFATDWIDEYDNYNLAQNIFEWLFSDDPDQLGYLIFKGTNATDFDDTLNFPSTYGNDSVSVYYNPLTNILSISIYVWRDELVSARTIEAGGIHIAIPEELDINYEQTEIFLIEQDIGDPQMVTNIINMSFDESVSAFEKGATLGKINKNLFDIVIGKLSPMVSFIFSIFGVDITPPPQSVNIPDYSKFNDANNYDTIVVPFIDPDVIDVGFSPDVHEVVVLIPLEGTYEGNSIAIQGVYTDYFETKQFYKENIMLG